LEFEDGYLYTGISADLDRRVGQHKAGLCRNTKNKGKIKLVYREEFGGKIDAARREKEIKGWRREKKENLIKSNEDNVYSE
jgi:predicted GIY-YIG superfamily endonuclease